jgi:hypothetical protein
MIFDRMAQERFHPRKTISELLYCPKTYNGPEYDTGHCEE